MIKLYFSAHSRATRPRWALEELGVPYEVVPIDFKKGEHKTPEYMKLHPLGLVPVMTEGDHVMIESTAMVCYLADRYADKKLAPALNSRERADYFQWIFFCTNTLEEPLVTIFKQTMFYPENKRNPVALADAKESFAKGVKVLSDHMKNRTYVVGNSFTMADIMVGSACNFAKFLNILNEYPVLTEFLKRVSDRPAFQKAISPN